MVAHHPAVYPPECRSRYLQCWLPQGFCPAERVEHEQRRAAPQGDQEPDANQLRHRTFLPLLFLGCFTYWSACTTFLTLIRPAPCCVDGYPRFTAVVCSTLRTCSKE